ncbi:MAG: 3-hydroxyacyl-CoA dehydrogenase NAD-binding domain-containing protein [Caulobacteraceae bacterium]
MARIGTTVDYEVQDGVAVVTVDNPPVNALSTALRTDMMEAFAQAAGDAAAKAVVLIAAGRTFIAGADITEFGKPPRSPSLQDVIDGLENMPKPVVAAIHGTALGGGLETALACHYRVAVPSARLGLPEVKLGLLPGAGGTQRLPRIVGVEAALEAITSGEPMAAAKALKVGLVDEVIEGDLKAGAVAFAGKMVGRPLSRVRDLDDKVAPARGKPEIFAEFRKANARKFRGFEAPEYCIQAIEGAVNLPFDEGAANERRLFSELVKGMQSQAQRYAFFAERAAAKIDVPADTPILPVEKVGILGAGTMGGGISMNFATAGIPVVLVETSQEALDRGVATIRKNYQSAVDRGRMTADELERRMARYSPTLDFNALADCDLVIEAVFELMDVKKEVFGRLDAVVKQGAILATNTSYLDVDEIASATRRPEWVVGMHFFSPANIMRLLEVVRGAKTSPSVLATAMAVGRKLAKVPVAVGVCHGFVGNRMLNQRQAEAGKLILEGAMPWDVDRVIYDFGMPMGPFAMADLAGLDLGWKAETSKSSTIREILCEQGRWGQKKSAGFYDYDASRKATPSPVTEQIIRDFAAKQGVAQRKIDDQEILERCLYPMVNEGAKILDKKIAARASDIDIIWLNGYGWPAYRGGPMFWADTVGLSKIVERLEHYGYEVAPLLKTLAAEGKRISEV